MVEYAAILAVVAGKSFSSLTSFDLSSFDLSLNTILLIGGFVFFFWLFAFKK